MKNNFLILVSVLFLNTLVLSCSNNISTVKNEQKNKHDLITVHFSESTLTDNRAAAFNPDKLTSSTITKYELSGNYTDNFYSAENEENSVEQQNLQISIEFTKYQDLLAYEEQIVPGNWSFTLNAYIDTEKVLTSTVNKNISSQNSGIEFELQYVPDLKGNLSVTITIPSTVVKGVKYKLLSLNDTEIIPDTAAEFTNSEISFKKSNIEPGDYILCITLYSSDDFSQSSYITSDSKLVKIAEFVTTKVTDTIDESLIIDNVKHVFKFATGNSNAVFKSSLNIESDYLEITGNSSAEVMLPGVDIFKSTPDDKIFAGWSCSGKTGTFTAGQKIRLSEDLIFTAKWESISTDPNVYTTWDDLCTAVNSCTVPDSVFVIGTSSMTASGENPLYIQNTVPVVIKANQNCVITRDSVWGKYDSDPSMIKPKADLTIGDGNYTITIDANKDVSRKNSVLVDSQLKSSNSISLNGVTIQNSVTKSMGGAAICLSNPITFTATDCSFIGNINEEGYYDGGAVSVQSACNVTFDSCNFDNNEIKVSKRGSAISVTDSGATVNILNTCIFNGNKTVFSGGAIYVSAGNVEIAGTEDSPVIFEANEAADCGGAIFVYGGNVSLSHVLMQNNFTSTTAGKGSGVYVTTSGTVAFNGVDISKNSTGSGVSDTSQNVYVDNAGKLQFTGGKNIVQSIYINKGNRDFANPFEVIAMGSGSSVNIEFKGINKESGIVFKLTDDSLADISSIVKYFKLVNPGYKITADSVHKTGIVTAAVSDGNVTGDISVGDFEKTQVKIEGSLNTTFIQKITYMPLIFTPAADSAFADNLPAEITYNFYNVSGQPLESSDKSATKGADSTFTIYPPPMDGVSVGDYSLVISAVSDDCIYEVLIVPIQIGY